MHRVVSKMLLSTIRGKFLKDDWMLLRVPSFWIVPFHLINIRFCISWEAIIILKVSIKKISSIRKNHWNRSAATEKPVREGVLSLPNLCCPSKGSSVLPRHCVSSSLLKSIQMLQAHAVIVLLPQAKCNILWCAQVHLFFSSCQILGGQEGLLRSPERSSKSSYESVAFLHLTSVQVN